LELSEDNFRLFSVFELGSFFFFSYAGAPSDLFRKKNFAEKMAGKKSSKKELFLQNLFEKACDLPESKVEGDREKGLRLLQALKKKKICTGKVSAGA